MSQQWNLIEARAGAELIRAGQWVTLEEAGGSAVFLDDVLCETMIALSMLVSGWTEEQIASDPVKSILFNKLQVYERAAPRFRESVDED